MGVPSTTPHTLTHTHPPPPWPPSTPTAFARPQRERFPGHAWMGAQIHINSKMRAILLDWIVLVAHKYKQVRARAHACGPRRQATAARAATTRPLATPRGGTPHCPTPPRHPPWQDTSSRPTAPGPRPSRHPLLPHPSPPRALAPPRSQSPETLFRTVALIDKYLSTTIVERHKLQLAGVAAMLLASKFEEVCGREV